MADKNPNKISESGIAKSISAGIGGEDASFAGVMQAIGGVRGVLETLLPGLVYIVTYIVTEDIKVSVIAPAALALLIVVVRLIQRQTLVTALSGVFGVAIAVAATLFTGRAEDFFLPGFWINGVWAVALIISVFIRWPLLGFLVGIIKNDLTGWKQDRRLYNAALFSTLIWLSLMILRLAVQLPLYFAGEVGPLGVARLVMGTPLFAFVVLFTWLIFRKTLVTSKRKES